MHRHFRRAVIVPFTAVVVGLLLLNGLLLGVLRPELGALERTSYDHARALSLAAELRESAAEARRTLDGAPPGGMGGPARLQAVTAAWERTSHELESLASSSTERLAVARLRTAVTQSAYGAERRAAAAERGAPVPTEVLTALAEGLGQTGEAASDIVLLHARQVRHLTRNEGTSLSWVLVTALVITAMTIGCALLLLRRAIAEASLQAEVIRQHAHDMSMFAARAAHDLRTPLQAITLSLQVARARGRVDGLERAESSARRMNETIRDLLEFSVASDGARPRGSARVEQVLEEVLEDLALRQQEELVLRREVEPGLEIGMVPGQLRTVLMNLLGNAARYAGGRPEARVEVRARGEGDRVRIEVADNGPGIEPAALPYVFEPCFRASAQPGGYGLGLATVKRLVEACGGEVAVASEPGRGATFSVALPGQVRAGVAPA